jgi:hypothetical protein
MWLRMLGRGRVQEQAIAELSALPVDNPLRTNALQLLYILQANLQANTPPILSRWLCQSSCQFFNRQLRQFCQQR